jgi:DNA-directed RNA polymerase subunit H (RpoH/RPB5)
MSAAVMSKSEGIGERTICLSLSSFLFASHIISFTEAGEMLRAAALTRSRLPRSMAAGPVALAIGAHARGPRASLRRRAHKNHHH